MRIVLVCVAFLTSGSVLARDLFGPHPGDMTRYELPGYTLVAADNLQLRRDMAKMPRLNRALELAVEVSAKPTGIPTHVCVASDSMWLRYLEPGPGIISEFVPTRFINYIIADNSQITRGGLFHEHTHLFLYMYGERIYPLWFEEGLAEIMESAEYTATNARFAPSARSDLGGWISIDRVLHATKSSPDYFQESTTYAFHFEAFSMTYRALIDDKQFGKQVDSYIEALNQLQTPEQAQASFGVNPDGLNYQMRAWVNRSDKNGARMKLGDIPEQPLPSGTPLSKLDSLLEIATISLDTGLGVERLDELLDAADKEPTGPYRTLVPRMRLAARRMDDALLLKIYGSAEPKFSDLQMARGAGLALFERVLTLDQKPAPLAQSAQMLTLSFRLLNRSLQAKPDDPEAVWAFATLAAGLKQDLDLALQRLAPMFERLPRNPDMAYAAALVLEARDDPNVQQFYSAVFKYAHTLEEKRWAAARLSALNEKSTATGSK